jgi:hypothetical protein
MAPPRQSSFTRAAMAATWASISGTITLRTSGVIRAISLRTVSISFACSAARICAISFLSRVSVSRGALRPPAMSALRSARICAISFRRRSSVSEMGLCGEIRQVGVTLLRALKGLGDYPCAGAIVRGPK